MIFKNPGNLPEQKIREKFGFYCRLTLSRDLVERRRDKFKKPLFLPITVKGTVLIPFMPVCFLSDFQ